MAGEGGDGAGEHGGAADWPVLLGVASAARRSRASSCRDDQGRYAHEPILMNKKNSHEIIHLLRCGKTIIAPVEIGKYPAQGNVMKFSCPKNMHGVSPRVPLRRGYTA
jgi:hypothetical protein